MNAVVADTSPINYLILIGHIGILPKLYSRVIVSEAVWAELNSPAAPTEVLRWTTFIPEWLEIRRPTGKLSLAEAAALDLLDPGERESIALALGNADLVLLIDEWAGRTTAANLQIEVLGTVGVLVLGARAGLVDLPLALRQLRQTNFRVSNALINRVLNEEGFPLQ